MVIVRLEIIVLIHLPSKILHIHPPPDWVTWISGIQATWKLGGGGGGNKPENRCKFKKNRIPIKITWYYSLTAKMLSGGGVSSRTSQLSV